ncbi:hypothetical protein F2981_31980 (plasmid) [Sinorhizobium meliloti]|nr:hypothetical protein [Sinorhizobium meliloti]
MAQTVENLHSRGGGPETRRARPAGDRPHLEGSDRLSRLPLDGAEMRGNSRWISGSWHFSARRRTCRSPASRRLLAARDPHLQHLRRAHLYARREGPADGKLGIGGPRRDYDDLNGFLERADELAEDLLSEGITAMRSGRSISRRRKAAASIFPGRTCASAGALREDPQARRRPRSTSWSSSTPCAVDARIQIARALEP